MERLFLLSDWQWSIHTFACSAAGQALLFGVAVVAALAFIVGYRTHLAAATSWFLLVSLHARNPMLLYGGDDLLRMLLFWSMFLPLGCAWSIDQARSAVQNRPASLHVSVASASILLQMFMLYFFAGLIKYNDVWLGGEALHRAFSPGIFSKPLARHLLEFPQMLEHVSRLVPWTEMLLPCLLFFPWKTVWVRSTALVLLFGFHLMAGLLLVTGIFQWVALSGLLLFLPSSAWDRMSAIRVLPRGSEAHWPSSRIDPVKALPNPKPIRFKPLERATQQVIPVLVVVSLLHVVAWNVATLHVHSYTRQNAMSWMREGSEGRFAPRLITRGYGVERMLGAFGAYGRVAGLYQHWNMFQHGGDGGGWHVLEGTVRGGLKINLRTGTRFESDGAYPRPSDPAAQYRNTRWRAYYEYLRRAKTVREFLPPVITRDWNRRQPELQIVELKIVFVQESMATADEASKRQEFVWYDGPAI
ncbi:MAG: HTTM domain-containing protein [Deltaproteobacteria bacterium]|nr:HTTM domain-containing protein [Deltaproteobacteria bacterium]